MIFKITSLVFAFVFTQQINAQQADTIFVKENTVKTSLLKEGTNRYLVYFKMGKDTNRTMTQFWTRSIRFEQFENRDVITVYQSWEDKDSIMHTTKSVCDKKTFAPLYQESWWKRGKTITTSTFNFIDKSGLIDGKALSDTDSTKNRKNAWAAFKKATDQYTLNWHLDLEVFQLLPFKQGKIFSIPYYDPGFNAPKQVVYTVSAMETIVGYNNQKIDCWVLTHTQGNNNESFWISKKTNEVIKMQDNIGGKLFRYKIKLPFSE